MVCLHLPTVVWKWQTATNSKLDYPYPGGAADANADPMNRIPAVPDADGRYTYEVPIESLDNPIAVTTYSDQKRMCKTAK